jgi:succinate dehydrogenase / fumarate reductase, membrane anchor subunit
MGNGTSIGRVRGLGSARTGGHHWLMERFSGIASLLTSIYLIVALLLLPDYGYATVRDWLARPIPATALLLFVLANFWHARMGVQVVIEDYVHEPANKVAAMVVLNLLAFAGAAFAIFFIVRVALGGA